MESQSKREVELEISKGPKVWGSLGIPGNFVCIEIRWQRCNIFLYAFAFGRSHDFF